MLLCQRTHKTHSNYHLVADELPFIPKVIDCMHQTIFGRPFVKRFALCYQTVVCLSVLSVSMHRACNTIIAAALSTSFILNRAPNSQELEALIARFRKSYISMSISHESKTLKKSRSDWLNSGNTLIQHLSEKKCHFRVSPFCQVVQKHTLLEMA